MPLRLSHTLSFPNILSPIPCLPRRAPGAARGAVCGDDVHPAGRAPRRARRAARARRDLPRPRVAQGRHAAQSVYIHITYWNVLLNQKTIINIFFK